MNIWDIEKLNELSWLSFKVGCSEGEEGKEELSQKNYC